MMGKIPLAARVQQTGDFCMPFPSRCIRKLAGSPDHLVRLEEEGWGNRDPKGLGSLEVDDQFELGGLLYGQVRRRGAPQDLIYKATARRQLSA